MGRFETHRAPASDLDAIVQIKEYMKVCFKPEAVDSVLASLYKHTWYLDSTIVLLALLDKNVSTEKKAAIADTLLSFYMPDSDFFKHRHKGQRDMISVIEKMNTSTLAPLIDKFSYLMFSIIGLDDQRVRDWLSLPLQYWHFQFSFQNFQKFAKTLILVNDHSERAVGMMQQFVHRYKKRLRSRTDY